MKRISIKNFRVFKDKQDIEFKPITLLVGPNNSGKSTIYKSLKLINEPVSPFSIPKMIDTRLGTKHNNSESSILSNDENPLEISIHIPLNNKTSLELILNYKDAILNKFELNYKNKTLMSLIWEEETVCQDEKGYVFKNASINLGLFRKLISTYLKAEEINLINDQSNLKEWEKSQEILAFFSTSIQEEKSSIEKKLLEIKDVKKLIHDPYFNFVSFDKLIPLNNDDSIFLQKLNSELDNLIDLKYFDDNYEKIRKSFEKQEVFLDSNNNDLVDIYVIWESLFSGFVQWRAQFIGKSGEVIPSSLSSFVKNNFIPVLQNKLNESLFQFYKIEKIPSIKTQNKKYFMLNEDSESFFEEVAKCIFSQFDSTSSKESNILYIEQWLQKFKIGTEIIPKYINSDIGEIYILGMNGKEINIFDMGFGVSQILSIIALPLKYFKDKMDYLNGDDAEFGGRDFTHSVNSPFFFLEEPESNLHPNWQSLLIELLVEMKRTFGIHFLIETHSEYMVRKLQFLVANKQIKTSDLIIYYINRDEDVSKKEPKIKEIIIREDGILANDFGPGFFDEAAKLTIDLLTIPSYN